MNLRNSTNKNRNNLALLRSQGFALEGGHPTTKQTLFYEDIYIYIYIYIYIIYIYIYIYLAFQKKSSNVIYDFLI